MHRLIVITKFTFGDRVRFESTAQGCNGIGTVFAITVDRERNVDYLIEIDRGTYTDLQPGILEHEITLLESDR